MFRNSLGILRWRRLNGTCRVIRRRSASWWIWGRVAMMKGWLAYLFGGLLVSAGAAEVGLVVIFMGMIAHWKYWLVGILAFFVGLYST